MRRKEITAMLLFLVMQVAQTSFTVSARVVRPDPVISSEVQEEQEQQTTEDSPLFQKKIEEGQAGEVIIHEYLPESTDKH